jgi:hypothetical protein
MAIMPVLMGLFQVAVCMEYLDSRFKDVESVVRDGLIKPEVENALRHLTDYSGACIDKLDKLSIDGVLLSIPEPFPKLEAGMEYLTSVSQATTAFARDCIDCLLEHGTTIASTMARRTIDFQHMVNDITINKTLVVKHLLKSASRVPLNESSKKAKDLMAEVGRLHAAWRCGPELEKDETFGDAVTHLRTTYKTARHAITIITCCSVLYELTGAKQQTECSYMLTNKKSVLPKALAAALVALQK